MMPIHDRGHRRASRAVVLLTVIALLAGCGRKGDITDFKPPPAPPPAKEQAPSTGG
jgi:predicted small lipoprotein YifL